MQKFFATFFVFRFREFTFPLALRNRQHFFDCVLLSESLLEFCMFCDDDTDPSFLLYFLLESSELDDDMI